MDSNKGSGRSKVKGTCRDPTGDEFLSSFISCWQCDTTCKTTDEDPVFLKALQKDGLYEKSILVWNSLQREGMYAIGKPWVSSGNTQFAGRGAVLQPQQHQMGENNQFGLV